MAVRWYHSNSEDANIEFVSLHNFRWRVVSIVVGLIVLVPFKSLYTTLHT